MPARECRQSPDPPSRHARRHDRHHQEARPGQGLGVPPEEFGIERGARDIKTCNYCFHEVVTKTEAQLIAEGFDEDQVKALGLHRQDRSKPLSRDSVRSISTAPASGVNRGAAGQDHRALRPDGLRGQRQALPVSGHHGRRSGRNPQARTARSASSRFDVIPFAATTPVPITHRFFGRSIADLVMPVQREKTALKRGALDNLYLHNNPRVEVRKQMLDRILSMICWLVAPWRRGADQNGRRAELASRPRHHRLIYPMMQYLDAELEPPNRVTKQGRASTPTPCRTNPRPLLLRCSPPRKCG
jgi:hypothetical protein